MIKKIYMVFEKQFFYNVLLYKNIYQTILHLACERGHLKIVKFLISLNKLNVAATFILIIYNLNEI